jgi:hypothetical protein
MRIGFLMVMAILLALVGGTGCFPSGMTRTNSRIVHYSETNLVEHRWYVRLRNAHTRVQRTFEVHSASRDRAIDHAMARARREGWGNAPVALVWVRRQGDNR